jgi:hypothetical protein
MMKTLIWILLVLAAAAASGCGRRVTVIEGPNGGTVTRVHRPLRPDVTIVKPAP